jgi:hypothetical protein
MPDFVRLDDHLPGTCLVCGDFPPPMWYLRELDSGQPALMCRGCITQLGRHVGMVDESEATGLRADLWATRQALEEAQDQVGVEKNSQIQVLSMKDVMEILGEGPPEQAVASKGPKYTVKRKAP